MREASSRLGPRRDDLEEQATEGHTDRERIGQLIHLLQGLPGRCREAGCAIGGDRSPSGWPEFALRRLAMRTAPPGWLSRPSGAASAAGASGKDAARVVGGRPRVPDNVTKSLARSGPVTISTARDAYCEWVRAGRGVRHVGPCAAQEDSASLSVLGVGRGIFHRWRGIGRRPSSEPPGSRSFPRAAT
jgi:hypothetical protein